MHPGLSPSHTLALREWAVTSDTVEQIAQAEKGDRHAAQGLLLSAAFALRYRVSEKMAAASAEAAASGGSNGSRILRAGDALPVPANLANWLASALEKIVHGEDANIALGVATEARPVEVRRETWKRLLATMHEAVVAYRCPLRDAAKATLQAARELNETAAFPMHRLPTEETLYRAYLRERKKLQGLLGITQNRA